MQALHDIFSVWGSLADMARDLDVPAATVIKWKKRNRIPSDLWGRVIEAAERRGAEITYPQIAEANAPRKGVSAV